MKEIRLIGMLLIALLLTACSHDEKTDGPKEPTTLRVYVYLLERPIVTRADEGSVSASEAEAKITKLQIWVFNSGTGDLISYYSPSTDDLTATTEGVTYHLRVSEAFEAAKEKPNVDVYVLANVSSYNDADDVAILLDKETTREKLEAAIMSGPVYGTSLTTAVPEDGLPMSGVLRGQSVSGSAPVYKLPTVKLMRTVSKVRFVFSAETSSEVTINSISLDEGMIPKQEYIFLKGGKVSLPEGVEYEEALDFGGSPGEGNSPGKIATNENPMEYIWHNDLDAQEYENKIDEAVNAETPALTQVGPFYLRESDKQLSGTINFTSNEQPEGKEVHFSMAAAGDFSRNHTWIVYAYYGGSSLEVSSVWVKEWEDKAPVDHNIHNW